ncbi:MAG TPA: hypothetical protein DCZ95_11565 [Verrucomicrobia bacterium]|nr:MAG: hypothetical protein A2X46_04035 [Lentisphaerae bacterium GWF2_57_35]HBA84722.1 hypothetical protein [Verrucomicrobiota bacterium]
MRKIMALMAVEAFTSASAALAYDDGDWQLWSTFEAGGKTQSGLEPKISQDLRLGDNLSEYFYTETFLSLGYNRNRIRAKSPWEFSPIKINPYVAWETNYEDDSHKESSDRWNRHRLYAGASAKFGGTFKGGLYYLRELNKKAGDWTDIDVLGIDVGASF